MLLRVPAGDVTHELAAEWNRPIAVAIAAVVGGEQAAPFERDVEPIGVVERVAGLVAQVHHDLALVLEVVQDALELRELGIGEIEGDADHRLSTRASPFVGEVAHRAEALETLAIELTVELLDAAL